jgi:methyl-accepting chemotaxis protein
MVPHYNTCTRCNVLSGEDIMISLTIKRKLIVSYILSAALIILVGGAGLFSLQKTIKNLEIIKDKNVLSILAINGISNGFSMIDSSEKILVNPLASSQERQSQYTRISDAWGQINEAMNAYSEIALNEDETKDWEKFKGAFDQWKSGHEKLISLIKEWEKKKNESTLKTMTEQALDLNAVSSGPIVMMLDSITEMNSKNIETISETSQKDSNLATYFLIAVIGFGLTLSIFFSILINRSISKPINLISEQIRDLSGGDLRSLVEIKSNDEFGKLSKMVNSFTSTMASIVKKIQGASLELSTASKEMFSTSESFAETAQNQSATTEEITATVEQISAGMEQITDNAKKQYDSLSSLTKVISRLSDSIVELDKTIDNSLHHTESISEEAKNGESSLREMNESMNRILDSSNAMTNIVEIISGISEQINLLSLNAAIEAARAGDSGRGFAVVADEISKLADQTATSIKEIDTLIKSNYSEINGGMDKIKNSITTTERIMDGVSKIAETINGISITMKDQMKVNSEINENIEGVLALSDQTRIATEEQKIAAVEISKSITNMNEMAQNNAAGAEELSGNASSVSTFADTLKNETEFFKT